MEPCQRSRVCQIPIPRPCLHERAPPFLLSPLFLYLSIQYSFFLGGAPFSENDPFFSSGNSTSKVVLRMEAMHHGIRDLFVVIALNSVKIMSPHLTAIFFIYTHTDRYIMAPFFAFQQLKRQKRIFLFAYSFFSISTMRILSYTHLQDSISMKSITAVHGSIFEFTIYSSWFLYTFDKGLGQGGPKFEFLFFIGINIKITYIKLYIRYTLLNFNFGSILIYLYIVHKVHVYL